MPVMEYGGSQLYFLTFYILLDVFIIRVKIQYTPELWIYKNLVIHNARDICIQCLSSPRIIPSFFSMRVMDIYIIFSVLEYFILNNIDNKNNL